MTLTRDSILALQRHFLGALSAPSRTRLEPLPAQPLVISGAAIRSEAEGCVADFGCVSSPGEERHVIRIGNRSGDTVDVRAEPPAWLMTTWLDADGDTLPLPSGGSAALELLMPHDAEREYQGAVRFHLGDRVEELRVRMTARRTHPIAQFDFHGSPHVRPYDFGIDDHPYVLHAGNATSVPLLVTFSDLPDWLIFEVEGKRRGGPIHGPFFERTAPFTVHLHPQNVGNHSGVLRIRTNDPRAEMQSFELPLAACVVAGVPCVRAIPPETVHLRADQRVSVTVRLSNWARVAATLAREAVPRALSVAACPIVPAALDGKPGTAELEIAIAPASLPVGSQMLTLSLRVEGGDPSRVDVLVPVDVAPPRRGIFRAETIAALFALLLLTLFVVILRGMA